MNSIIETIKSKEFKKGLEQEIVERLKKLGLPKSKEQVDIDNIIDNYNICFTYSYSDGLALMLIVGLTDNNELLVVERENAYESNIETWPLDSLALEELIGIAEEV